VKALITGGAGYIGSHLVKHLTKLGVECFVIDNLSRGRIERIPSRVKFEQIDLCDSKKLSKFIKCNSFEAIFHLAGYMQARESMREPNLYYQNNVQATRNLINSILAPEKTKVIFSSSCSVYGNNNLANEDSPLSPLSNYAKTKSQSEIEFRRAFDAYPKNLSIFRFFNVVGCSEIPLFCDIQNETILPASARRILQGKKPLIFGGGFRTEDSFAVRDFIDVRDLVKALSLPISHDLSGIHNLSANQALSIKRVINLLLEISDNKELGFEIGESNTADPSIIRSKTSARITQLGWKPNFNMRESVESFWVIFKNYWSEMEKV
jgi:UDP-glucose 4-epimerase